LGVNVTEMLLLTGMGVTVIEAVVDFVPSATDVAVSVTEAGVGGVAGAEYETATPEALDAAESVPQALPVQPAPESCQLTPLLCASLATVAVKL
jgi:phosphate/sulfate permease